MPAKRRMVGTSIKASSNGWVAQRIPLLQQMNPQHGGQRIGRAATFLAGLGVVGLDQRYQRLPGHHHLHLSQEFLPLGLLLVAPPRSTLGRGNGCGELVIREAELLATYQPSPDLRSQIHVRAVALGFPESP